MRLALFLLWLSLQDVYRVAPYMITVLLGAVFLAWRCCWDDVVWAVDGRGTADPMVMSY